MSKSPIFLLLMALLLGACSLMPEYRQPASPSAARFASGPACAAPSATDAPVTAGADWQRLFQAPSIHRLIANALDDNRELRVAVLNVEAFQAQYRIQRTDPFPAVSANGSGSRWQVPGRLIGTGKSAISSTYSANLQADEESPNLTASTGSLSNELSGLFKTGSGGWTRSICTPPLAGHGHSRPTTWHCPI